MRDQRLTPRKRIEIPLFIAFGTSVAVLWATVPLLELDWRPRLIAVLAFVSIFLLGALIILTSLRMEISDDEILITRLWIFKRRISKKSSLASFTTFFGVPYVQLADVENYSIILPWAIRPHFDVDRIALYRFSDTKVFHNERAKRRLHAGKTIKHPGTLFYFFGFAFFSGLILWQPSEFTSLSVNLILPVAAVGSLYISILCMKTVALVDGKIITRHLGRRCAYSVEDVQRYEDGWLGRRFFCTSESFLLVEYHPANNPLAEMIDEAGKTS